MESMEGKNVDKGLERIKRQSRCVFVWETEVETRITVK